MVLPTQTVASYRGNMMSADAFRIRYDAMTDAETPATSSASISAGTGAPTFAAPKGTLYIRLDASTTATRLYINTNGSTTWTNFTAAA